MNQQNVSEQKQQSVCSSGRKRKSVPDAPQTGWLWSMEVTIMRIGPVSRFLLWEIIFSSARCPRWPPNFAELQMLFHHCQRNEPLKQSLETPFYLQKRLWCRSALPLLWSTITRNLMALVLAVCHGSDKYSPWPWAQGQACWTGKWAQLETCDHGWVPGPL